MPQMSAVVRQCFFFVIFSASRNIVITLHNSQQEVMSSAINSGAILITLPCLQDPGGVASFYNGILPYFPRGQVIPLEIGGSKKFGGLLYPLADQIRFHRIVKKVNPALVHLNPSLITRSFIRDGLFAWQAKKMGCPLLIFWHGWCEDFESVVEKRYLGFFKRTFGLADGFVVLGSGFEQKLREWGVSVPIYRETTNVEDSLLADIDIQAKWIDLDHLKEVKILFLARLEREKGVFETLQAVKFLIDKKLPVSLTITGDGQILQELKEYAHSLNLTPQQVHFTGDIRGEEKIRILADHHIYCFPTFFGEGLPTSVLEAMAFGMPVITRHVGGLADIFEDGTMGHLVHGKSPEEIAACLEKIIVDPDKMLEMGMYNAKYAKEHFMASVVVKRLLRIYEELIIDGRS